MKIRLLAIGLGVITLTGCSIHSSDNVDIDGEDITYVKDSRTNLCFGVMASRKSFSTDAIGLSLTCVPCESVEHLIK